MDLSTKTQIVERDLLTAADTTEFMYSRDEENRTIATEYSDDGDIVAHYVVTISLTPID